ncbi:hypothetical protein SAMN05519103_03653 [Rhizobiales bacterium GAS113]|jgi:hypothetical protein|nr:hypothetical protein SAMN05519103_03653 [Rhizobiales bacterium GAS113]
MELRTAIVLALFAVTPFAEAGAGEVVSAYTKHDYERCKLVSRDVASQTRKCRGIAGIAINYQNDDDNSVIDFGKEGLVGERGYDEGAVFAGKTIEWRGVRRRGALAPYAAIVRFDMGRSVSGPFRPQLMIFRLEGTQRSCVVASLDARKPNADEKARQIADDIAATFACGKDKARAPE